MSKPIEDPTKPTLSDKAAIEMAKSMKSIETTSKMGGWMAMINMAMSLIDFSENPLVKVVMDFFSLISATINAEFAESAAKLAETLFSKETTDNINTMADGAGELNKLIIPFMDWIFSMNNTLPDLIKLGGEWSASIGKWYNDLNSFTIGVGEGIEDLVNKLGSFLDIIDRVKDSIASISVGGGGDGGGDDDTPWWPFD